MMRAVAVALALVASAAQAQQQPYAGQEQRDLKALSTEEVKQYLAGSGMGYARSAELNQYPGPMHVLELADRLELSDAQRKRTQALMDAHKVEARAIGAKLVETERALEALFQSGSANESALAQAVRAAASAQGEYRLSHLETHRRMRALLNDEQVKRYDELRGYASGEQGGHQHKH